MPFFQKKKSEKKKHGGGLADPVTNPSSYNGAGEPPPTTAPSYGSPSGNPTVANDAMQPSGRGSGGGASQQSPARRQATEVYEPPTPRRLVFNAFLAHGSPPGKVEGFTNVKELYEKIGQAFSMPADQIIFCTLNTFKVDMDKLLGGQIGLSDSIYAHIKGQKYEICVEKSEAALGLTITDNGAGFAFVKRIKEGSVMAQNGYAEVGDHLVMINDRSMIGCRHFEVARALKDLPIGQEFTMKLVKPHKAFNEIAPRGSKAASAGNNNIKTGKETLRLYSKGPAKVQALPTEYEEAACRKVDDCLESYMGIRDLDLATSIVDMFKGKNDFVEFMTAFEENFSDFGFPEEFVFEVWGFINDAKEKRLKTDGANSNTVVAEFDEQF
ncbi:PDZ domain-containing protein GIPC1-like [Diadema setosum]|uniref:PDZ domain-containing protein GIPC1-like n=1 Tax=Diadema setosum TaxID=31175 RepID=UPI003B3B9E13